MIATDRTILFYFRGVPVVHVTSLRIPSDERQEGLFYYDIRHDEEDWCEPVTVEPGVLVNHFGTMVTTKPLTFSTEFGFQSIEITEEEKEMIYHHI